MESEREKLTAQVAQLWCLPKHANKEMDVDFGESIIDLIIDDRRKVLEEVEKPLKDIAEQFDNGEIDIMHGGVQEALTKIQSLKEGAK